MSAAPKPTVPPTGCGHCGRPEDTCSDCGYGAPPRPVLASGLTADEAARLGARLPRGTVRVSFGGAK